METHSALRTRVIINLIVVVVVIVSCGVRLNPEPKLSYHYHHHHHRCLLRIDASSVFFFIRCSADVCCYMYEERVVVADQRRGALLLSA